MNSLLGLVLRWLERHSQSKLSTDVSPRRLSLLIRVFSCSEHFSVLVEKLFLLHFQLAFKTRKVF